MKRKMYLLQRISDKKGNPYGWRKGEMVWADSPCKGWRIVKIVYVD